MSQSRRPGNADSEIVLFRGRRGGRPATGPPTCAGRGAGELRAGSRRCSRRRGAAEPRSTLRGRARPRTPPSRDASRPRIAPARDRAGRSARCWARSAGAGWAWCYAARDTACSAARSRSRCCSPRAAPTPRPPPGSPARPRITGRLQHPGIPPVHDLGTLPDGRPFLAMKLIRGRTLADLLPARPTRRPTAPGSSAVFEQVCQAVGYAHRQGVIHRDLKPANVMVGAFGEVQVMDWGLAKDCRAGGVSRSGRGAEPARRRRSGPDRRRRVDDAGRERAGHAGVHAAGAGPGRSTRSDARADVFALGGDPVRDPDRAAAVRRGRRPRRSGRRAAGRTRPTPSPGSTPAGRTRNWSRWRSGAWPRPGRPAGRRRGGGGGGGGVPGRRSRSGCGRPSGAGGGRGRAAEQRKRRRVQLALAAVAVVLLLAGAGVAPSAEAA